MLDEVYDKMMIFGNLVDDIGNSRGRAGWRLLQGVRVRLPSAWGVCYNLSLCGVTPPQSDQSRKGGRVVECAGLEIQYTFLAYRGFESLPFRQIPNKKSALRVAFFIHQQDVRLL